MFLTSMATTVLLHFKHFDTTIIQ